MVHETLHVIRCCYTIKCMIIWCMKTDTQTQRMLGIMKQLVAAPF
jgi:hypothetical protein